MNRSQLLSSPRKLRVSETVRGVHRIELIPFPENTMPNKGQLIHAVTGISLHLG